jgi:putative Holliday junction resolvase
MPIRNPADLADPAPTQGRLMGLDIGTKTIGIALSDTRRIIASPLETIRRGRFRADAAALRALAEGHGVAGLVLGLPVGLDGTEGPRCQSVRQFARNLLALWEIDITFWDERMSTAAVTRAMIAADLSRRRRAALVDKAAAAYILQGCLDYLARRRHEAPPLLATCPAAGRPPSE